MNNAILTLQMVLNTLEGMTVSGKQNADRYLGAIQGIEAVIGMLQQPAPAPEEPKEEVADG